MWVGEKELAEVPKEATKPAGKEEVSYIVKGSVKEFLKKAGKRTDPDTFAELNKIVEGKLKRAVVRADKNKRSTVRPEDL